MKKILLFMLGVLAALPGIARDFTYEYEGQTLTYTVLDEDAKTCQTKEGYSVTHVDLGTFWHPGNDVWGNLTIPAVAKDGDVEYSVIQIGYASFVGGNLTSVIIPKSVDGIGYNAFGDCSDMVKFAYPDCWQGNPFTKGEGIGYPSDAIIEDGFIYSADKSTIYFAPVSLSGDYVIPASVTEIGTSAFAGCSGLTSIEIPKSITEIRDKTFMYCDNLSWLIIPEWVEKIGSRAFAGTSYVVNYHQYYKSRLFSLMFLPKHCDVASDAFDDCKYLNKVAAYDTSLFVSDGIFSNINAKWAIEDGETVDAEKGIIWDADNSYCWVSGKYTGVLRIPDGVTQLHWSLLAECPKITEVYLPNTLEEIGPQAFYGLTIKEIVIPNRVTTIYDGAFKEVSPVKVASPDVLTLPFDESVTVIKYDAFNGKVSNNFVYSRHKDVLYYAPLSVSPKFEVPETVTEITDKAFALCDALVEIFLPEGLSKLGNNVWDKCTNIKSVVCNSSTPVEASRDLFPVGIYDTATLYVPKGSKSKYMSTVPWKYFENISEEYKSGIDDVITDTPAEGNIDFNAPVEVYNLQGALVGRSLDTVAPGIYIVRQGAIVKKIAKK